MLERAAALRRQWGLRWRKVGVYVLVARCGRWNEDGSVLGPCSRRRPRRLAGIAVTGPAHTLAAYEDAGRLADDLGLFLVLCEAT